MRRLLVIAIVIGSVLFLQAPAQAAVHLYLKMSAGGIPIVDTDCPKGSTLKITVGTLSRSITVPKDTEFTPADLNATQADGLNRVAARARSAGTNAVRATCTPPSNGHTKMTVLPFTGVAANRLALGLGLLGVGTVLLRLGRSPSPRRPRLPVKVDAT
jgi:hypothetical protein